MATSDGHVLCTNVETLCNGCLEIMFPYSIDVHDTIEFSLDNIVDKFGNMFFMRYGADGSLHLPHYHE